MPKQLLLYFLIEIALIMVTIVLLASPRLVFPVRTEKARMTVACGGMAFLCILFCWSIILGSSIALLEPAFRF